MDTKQALNQLPVNSTETQVVEQPAARKPFVEPEVSSPIDVLEVTTFQQAVTTGVTN